MSRTPTQPQVVAVDNPSSARSGVFEHDDAPQAPNRPPSSLYSRGAQGILSALVGDRLERSTRDALSDAIGGLVEDHVREHLDAYSKARKEAIHEQPSQVRASIPWAITFVLMFVLMFVLAGAVSLQIHDIRDRQDEADRYDMVLAQWLVVDHANTFDGLKGLDRMLRTVALAVGADVEDIEAPVEAEPPNEVQMLNWRGKAGE